MSLGKKLKEWATVHGRESAVEMLSEGRANGKITNDQISIRDIAEATMGKNWPVELSRASANGFRGTESAADAVDPTTFAAITGNLLIEKVKEKFKSPEFIGDDLVENIPVTNGNLDEQKVPWLSDVLPSDGGVEQKIQAGMPYPRTGFKPNYYQLARPEKTGSIVAVTFEMIYADRTKQAQDSAASVGRMLGRDREYRILRMVMGLQNNFKFSFGNSAETSSNTYHRAAGTVGTWLNEVNNLPLTNWRDLNTVEQIFARMVDPVTGHPMAIDTAGMKLFVMPGNLHNARMVTHATNVRTGPYAASGATTTIQESANDVQLYDIITSKHAMYLANNNEAFPVGDNTSSATMTAAQANELWFLGNFQRAFYYRSVSNGVETFMAPPQNPEEFNRDIVLQIKAREYGVAGVQDPYQVCRVYGHNVTDSTTPS